MVDYFELIHLLVENNKLLNLKTEYISLIKQQTQNLELDKQNVKYEFLGLLTLISYIIINYYFF